MGKNSTKEPMAYNPQIELFPDDVMTEIAKDYWGDNAEYFKHRSRGKILTTKFYNECSIHQKINSRAMWDSFPKYHPTWKLMPNYATCIYQIVCNNFDTPFHELYEVRKLKHI